MSRVKINANIGNSAVTSDIEGELEKLQRNLGVLRRMTKLPEAVFILDTKKAGADKYVLAIFGPAGEAPHANFTSGLDALPQIAQGESNKVWIIPSEVTRALGQLTDALPRRSDEPES